MTVDKSVPSPQKKPGVADALAARAPQPNRDTRENAGQLAGRREIRRDRAFAPMPDLGQRRGQRRRDRIVADRTQYQVPWRRGDLGDAGDGLGCAPRVARLAATGLGRRLEPGTRAGRIVGNAVGRLLQGAPGEIGPLEPGGAVSVAAMLEHFNSCLHRDIVCVISGGNFTRSL